MKITNFVKSAKTSFLAPLTPKCTRVLRTTAWQAKPKQHNSTHGTGPVLETLSYYFVALLSHCKDGQELRIWCSCWWDVTFIVIESPLFIWSSGTEVLRQANANCHFCLSAKCFKIVIFLGFAIPHHLKRFRFEPLSFWYPEFIETTQRLQLTCITHQLEHFPIIHVQTGNLPTISQVCDSS